MENIFSSFSLDCKQEIIYRFSQAQKRSSLFFSDTTCPGRVVRLGAQCTDHWTTEQSRGVGVPAVQLTTHVKSSTLYGRTVVHPNFFGLMGYYYFCIIIGLRSASSTINGRSPNLFTWRWQFFFLAEKKGKEIYRLRIWAYIFRVKWCTVGMHNAMARIGLETNSSGDVSLGKEKAPLLKWIC